MKQEHPDELRGELVEVDTDDQRPNSSVLSGILLHPRTLIGTLAVLFVLTIVFAAEMVRPNTVVIPDLIGLQVDPQLDDLREGLDGRDLVLDNVSTVPCPPIAQTPLDALPGTVISQNPAAGKRVDVFSAVDVTICLPKQGT